MVFSGCSIRRLAINQLAKAMAGSGEVFASDDDPELIQSALPFALKTLETLLAEAPDHPGLLLAACRGFTQYGAGFVELEAERLAPTDYWGRERAHGRALKLFLRARDYCLRGLEIELPGLPAALRQTPTEAFAQVKVNAEQLPLLYWTAVSWGSAISRGLDRPELVVDLPAVRALLEGALKLGEDYDRGALHEAMITLEALPAHMGGSLERARQHYERALALNTGTRASTHVTWASAVAIRQQDRAEFTQQLQRALAVDVDRVPGERLSNLVSQERARILLAQIDELFLDDPAADSPVEDPPLTKGN